MDEQQSQTNISDSLLNALVKRRGRRVVIVSSLLESLKDDTSRTELVNTFRKLEAAGCGRFIVGRRKKESRFVWDIEPKRVVEKLKHSDYTRNFLSGTEEGRPETGSVLRVTSYNSAKNSSNSPVLMHQFPLRPGFVVKLELPQDLSVLETARFLDFIKSLCVDVTHR